MIDLNIIPASESNPAIDQIRQESLGMLEPIHVRLAEAEWIDDSEFLTEVHSRRESGLHRFDFRRSSQPDYSALPKLTCWN